MFTYENSQFLNKEHHFYFLHLGTGSYFIVKNFNVCTANILTTKIIVFPTVVLLVFWLQRTVKSTKLVSWSCVKMTFKVQWGKRTQIKFWFALGSRFTLNRFVGSKDPNLTKPLFERELIKHRKIKDRNLNELCLKLTLSSIFLIIYSIDMGMIFTHFSLGNKKWK